MVMFTNNNIWFLNTRDNKPTTSVDFQEDGVKTMVQLG